ncbi:MAG TPA: GYD domain-containing protein [Gemmatimonadales bacterium]|jgi:uncharacterized protein with GYD domain|nr:GYD domain-containing protein [Gemmatimonadales bacterium]
MAKYLLKVSYSAEGTKGLIKDGGTKRRAMAQQLVQSAGGKLEVFYFAFGDCDAYAIADMPDAVSGAAASLAVNATGAVSIKTTMLLTPEEMDAAAKKTISYKPPGS